MNRPRLLSGTALITLFALALPGQVFAACSPNVPTSGQTVTCTGADTTGISGGAGAVIVNVNSGASIITTGVNAINLGSGNITAASGTTISSDTTTIRFGNGTFSSNGTISSSTGTALQYIGTAGQTLSLFQSGTITGVGTALDFGQANALLYLGQASVINGNVLAGTGTTDTLTLSGSAGASANFNASDIGTKYTGFDVFQKTVANTWTLTGTGNQAWGVTAGTLQGDTTSMSGALAISSGANVTFNQSTNGTTTGVISGAGTVTKTGTGTVVLGGVNSYSGGTIINSGSLTIPFDAALGAAGTTLTLGGGALGLSGNVTSARNITLTANSSVFSSGNSVLSGVISGTGGLSRAGGSNGTVALTGANTFTGTVGVTNGALNVSADNNLGNTANSIALSGGTLQYGAGFASARNIALASASSSMIDTNSFNSTLSGVVSGSGALTKTGTGTLTLSGTNTFTGGLTVNGGLVSFASSSNLGTASATLDGGGIQYSSAGYTLSKNLTLGAGGGTIDTNGFAVVESGIISGTGALTKTSSGTLILGGANTYTGGTIISSGVVQGDTTSLTGNITDNAGLNFLQSTSGTYGGVISGTGSVGKFGTGTVTLTGTNTYTGGTSINAGAFNISSDTNLGNTSGALTLNGGTLQAGAVMSLGRAITLGASGGTIDTQGFGVTVGSVFSGAGSLTKIGSNNLLLTGTNTYTGGTIINDGAIRFGSDAALGNTSGGITFGGTGNGQLFTTAAVTSARSILLNANGAFATNSLNSTLSGIISGTGAFIKSGAGTLTLTGNNTYTGGTTISGGTLNIDRSAALGALAGNLTMSGGTLQYAAAVSTARNIILSGSGTIDNNGFDSTLSGVISSTGTLTKTGAGTLTLSGTNTYTGGTIISGGVLAITADNNLGGIGNLVFNGGTLQTGSTFTTARSITINAAGGTIDTNSFGPTLSGTITANGNLTKTGAGNLGIGGSMSGAGSLLFSTTGTLTNLGSITSTGTTAIQYTGTAGQAFLVSESGSISGATNAIDFAQAAAQLNLGNTYSITGNVLAGTGTTDTLRLSGSGAATFNASNIGTQYTGFDLFQKIGASSIWTLTGTGNQSWDVQAGTLIGDTTSMSGPLAVASGANVTFNQSTTGTASSVISGAGSVTKLGTGTVTLSGVNTYTGGTNVSSGTLSVNADNNLGGTGGITLSGGGTLDLHSAFSSARAISLTGAGIVHNDGANTLNGVISGTGQLTKNGLGVLTLSGANTYTGGTVIAQGTLNAAADNNLGGTGGLTLSGGTFQFGSSYTTARNVAVTSNSTIDSGSFADIISGVISGSGTVTKTGSGTLSITSAVGNTNTGGWIISAGTLAATTFNFNGNVANSGSLQFNQSSNGTYAGVISGTGSLIKGLGGIVTLTGANTYSGGTNIAAGGLNASADNNLGAVSGALALNSGTLQYGASYDSARNIVIGATGGTIDTNSFTSNLSGIASGSGALTKTGTGTLTLSGTNTYTGGTSVTGGTLAIGADNNLGNSAGAVALSNTSGLQFNTSMSSARNISTTGPNNVLNTLANNVTLSGVLSGGGGLVKAGSGTLLLSGTNTFTGGINVGTGTVEVSADNNLGAAGGILFVGNGTLKYDSGFTSSRAVQLIGTGGFDTNGNNSSLSGVISGSTALRKAGAGTLTVSGTNTYTGGTVISGGTLDISADANLGNSSGGVTISNGATLQTSSSLTSARTISLGTGGGIIYTSIYTPTLSGIISGAGSLTKNGSGTLTLSGTNTYTGGTSVTGGTLSASTVDSIGSGTLTLDGGTYGMGQFTNTNAVVLGAGGGILSTSSGGLSQISGVISGSGSLTKTGTSTLTLSGANTYTGGTIIKAGFFKVANENNLGNVSGALTLDGGTLSYGASYDSARNIILTSANGTLNTATFNSNVSGVISGAGSLTKSGTGILNLSGVNTYTGGTSVTGGILQISQLSNLGTGDVSLVSGGGIETLTTMVFSKNIALSGTGGTLYNTSGGISNFSGVISGTGPLTKSGLNSIILSGANTYTGGTILNSGNLYIGAENNLGNVSGALTLNNLTGSSLFYQGAFSSARNIILNASSSLNTGGFNDTVSGVVSGTGGLTKAGTGTLTLSGTNTYTGGTSVTAGTLNVSADANLGGTGGIILNGGILQTGAAISSSRTISLGASGGTLDASTFQSTLSGVVSGAGVLNVTGSSGRIILGGANTNTGGITVNGASLQGTTDSLKGDIVNNSTVFFTQNTNGAYNGNMSGSGALNKYGSGTVTLSGNNTYTGPTRIYAGILKASSDSNLGDTSSAVRIYNNTAFQYGAGFTTARAFAIDSTNGTIDTNGFNSAITGVISGAGLLTKTGSGTLTLLGANTITGGISIAGGALNVSADNNLGDATGGLVIGGGTLQYGASFNTARALAITSASSTIDTNGFNSTVSGIISNSGKLVKTGVGTLTLGGANTYTGGTAITGGILNVSADNNLGDPTSSLTINTGTLQYGSSFNTTRNIAINSASSAIDLNGFNTTLSGVISGTGKLNQRGNGTLTLTGANTYSGGTDIAAGGILNANTDSALGNASGNLVIHSGATFQNGGSFLSARSVTVGAGAVIDTNGYNSTLSGIISGSITGMAVQKNGAGTLTLSGVNTFVEGISVNAGTLNVGADNNLGATSGDLTLNGGTLQYGAGFSSSRNVILGASNATIDTNSFNSLLSGVISGAGSLTKIGSGTLTLTGANTYSGGTIVNAGTLLINDNSNLGTGPVLTFNGGGLKYAAGFVSTQDVSLTGNSSIDTNGFNSSISGVISGTGSLNKAGSGTLALTAANTYSGGTSVTGGTLNVSADNNLGATSGALTLNGGTLQYGSSFSSARNVTLGPGNGIVDTNNFSSSLTGIISGSGSLTKSGNGTLALTGTNTYTGGTFVTGGALNVSSDANLGNASSALTLNGGTLQYGSGFSSARAVTLGASGGTADTNGNDSTLSGVVSGTGSLTKTGSGTLALSGANTYSGGTIVNGGTLSVAAANNLGGAGSLILNGGTLLYSTGFNTGRAVVLGASGGTITNNSAAGSSLSGVISGTGSLNKNGTATLVLSGANTYTGGTVINAGSLNINSDNNLGNTSGTLTLDGGTLKSLVALTIARDVVLGASSGTFNVNGLSDTLSGTISGTGSLSLTGGGTLALTGNNTFTGGLKIYSGSLSVSSDSNLGDAAQNIYISGGILKYGSSFDNMHTVTLGPSNGTVNTNGFDAGISGSVNGTGALTKTGTGTLTLTGANTYSGGTTVSGGTLAGTTNALQGDITDNATVAFDQTTDGTYADILSGTGSLIKTGAGNVTLLGTNTYTGGTTVTAGTLTGSTTSLQGNILDNAALVFDQNGGGGFTSIISGTGSLTKTGSGTVTLSGANTYTGGTTVSGGTLTGTTTSLQGDILNNAIVKFNQATSGTYGGTMSGAGMLTKYGTGTLTLSGANTYSSGTVIAGGNLVGTTENIQGDILDNSILTFFQNTDATFADIITGTGALTKTGTGALTLTGINDYSGGTTISSGSLIGTTDNLQGDILDNANLTFNQTTAGTYADVISGSGSFIKTGAGNLILSGTNTYTGGTTVSDGRLAVNGAVIGTTTVASGGNLGGNGNFGAIIADGHLSPGNSIGTMHVTGPVTFNAGSVYDVEVDANGNSDKITATGAITINGGTVNIISATGAYNAVTDYLSIVSGSSRTGMFDGITSNLAFLSPSLTYTPTAVNLTLVRNNVTFSSIAADQSQAGVANSIEALGTNNDLYRAFSGLSMTQAIQALDTLSGEHNAGITTATAQSASAVRNVIIDRFRTLQQNQTNQTSSYPPSDGGPVSDNSDSTDDNSYASVTPAAGDEEQTDIKKSFWSQGFGNYGHSQAQGTAPGQNRKSAGALFGGDAEFSDDTYVGAFGGYETGEVYTDSEFADTDMQNYHAGIYGSTNIKPSWRLSGGLIGTVHSLDTTRHIEFTGYSETAKGHTTGFTISPFVETGYQIETQTVTFEPFLNLSLTHSHIGGYDEEEGGSANLNVDSVSQTTPSHTVGVNFTKSFPLGETTTAGVHGHVGWTHNYGSLGTPTNMKFEDGALPFKVDGAPLAKNSADVGVGAEMSLFNGSANAYADYDGSLSPQSNEHTFRIGVKVPF